MSLDVPKCPIFWGWDMLEGSGFRVQLVRRPDTQLPALSTSDQRPQCTKMHHFDDVPIWCIPRSRWTAGPPPCDGSPQACRIGPIGEARMPLGLTPIPEF